MEPRRRRLTDAERLEIIRRDFEEVAAGNQFLDLLERAPAVWRQRPAHFHLCLARKLADLTQAELAARAGLDQSFVSRAERGRDVRLSTMRRLSEALGYRMLVVPLKRRAPNSVRPEGEENPNAGMPSRT